MTANKIIADNQYGFIKNKGTKDALCDISKTIYEKLDKSKPIAIAFIDLAKAFDTVNHKILLEKLYNYGIRGSSLKLIESYLENRMQKVRVGQAESEISAIKIGVPQGTILGPLLFIIYVNDLLTSMPNGSILSYADDTAIIATDETWDKVEKKLNKYINEAACWLALNELSLNLDKTVFITFGNYCDSVPVNMKITIGNKEIKRVESCKYLGLIFDCNMRWNIHVEHIIQKTRYLIFVFYKISKYMHTDTLKMIYYAFFHSIINYGIIAWGGAYSNCVNILQNMQKRLIKIIKKNNYESVNPLTIRQLFGYESLRYYYELLKNKYINSSSITRKKSIQLPLMTKVISNKISYISAITLYNELPKDLKTLETIRNKTNVRRIKQWICTNII